MSDDLFSDKESIRDILFAIEDKVSRGLFSVAIDNFDKLIQIDDKYPLLYERLACIKFWVNREEFIEAKKDNLLEWANILNSYYMEFKTFAAKYEIDESVDIFIAIRDYVFTNVVNIFEHQYKANGDANILRSLCYALIEIKQYKKAIKGLEHLLRINYADGEILSELSSLYNYFKDDYRSKFYIREALFYDPFNIDKFLLQSNIYIEKALLIAREHLDFLDSDEDILLWAAVYADVYNIWNESYSVKENEVLVIRKLISKFEADCKKKNMRKNMAPRLFLAYTRLISFLIISAKENIDEIEFIIRKMDILDGSLTRTFVENLNI